MKKPLVPTLTGLKAKWRELSHHARHIIINCLLGLLVVVIVHEMQGINFVSAQVARGYDLMLKIQSNSDMENASPFVFLDIDSDTHIAWNEPIFTPRDKLTELLTFALNSSAKAVLLDIDVNLGIDNSAIADLLQSHDQNSNPPLILMKTFREQGSTSNRDYLQLRPSSLDSIVAMNPNIHWASPLFDVESDYILRRWKQWAAGCYENQPVLLPSSQLLLLSVAEDPAATSFYQAIDNILPPSCDGWSDVRSKLLDATVTAGKHIVHWQGSDLQRSIMFNLPWKSSEKTPTTLIERHGEQIEVPAVTTIPAHIITESTNTPDKQLLNDHYVIIGNSSNFAGDIHATPLGMMPGSLVIINAIQSLSSIGEVHPPSFGVILLVELALLVITSLLFTSLPPKQAALLSTGFVTFVVFPVACLLFKDGVWLNFSLPLIAVQLHELISTAEEKFKSKLRNHNEATS